MAIAVKGSGEMDELKPCPFCGGKAVLEHTYWAYSKCSYIICVSCLAKSKSFPISTEESSDKQAADVWNQREDSDRKPGRWLNPELIPDSIDGHMHAECSVCHEVRIVDNFCPNCGSRNLFEDDDESVHCE